MGPRGNDSTTINSPAARPFHCAAALAPLSIHPDTAIDAPSSTFTKRKARTTSAVAMTATVTTSAPITWALWAAGGIDPKTPGEDMTHTPTSAVPANVQGTETPQVAGSNMAMMGAP